MILDVGCGSRPRGDVNIDISYNFNKNYKKTPKNYIVCDGSYLPFRSKIFSLIYCAHVLELFIEPIKVMKEFVRVSNLCYIIINNRTILYDHKPHYYSWSENSITNFTSLFYGDISITLFTRSIRLKKMPLFKAITKIPFFNKYIYLVLSKMIRMEIHVICSNPF